MPRELVLVGGGHAHIEVIRRWAANSPAGVRLTVFDPNPRPVYSGMVPGFVAGQYERHELEIDLAALCARAGAELVPCPVTAVDPHDRILHFDRGTRGYDIASLDVGSTVAGLELPGVREHALCSRPITGLVAGIDRLIREGAHDGGSAGPYRVVGAGAAGVELAFCLESRLRQGGARTAVSLVTSDSGAVAAAHASVRRRVARGLARRRIEIVPDTLVTALRPDAIEREQGEPLRSSGTLWVTGPAAHALTAQSGLPVDSEGYARIGSTLQVEGHENLFAVGDCASLNGAKKAGVYAVRSGPLLDHNLRAKLADEPLHRYEPQHDFLSLLNLGDGTAIGSKWGFALEGRMMMRLKDRIDRSFMERYR
jgi:selenide,water dikinase